MGHAAFVGLSKRGVLNVFHAVYRFIDRNYDGQAILWRSVREEQEAFAGLLIFLRQRWTIQWNELVFSTDASLSGYGATQCFFPRSEVAAIGRPREIQRFLLNPGASAGVSALGKVSHYAQETD